MSDGDGLVERLDVLAELMERRGVVELQAAGIRMVMPLKRPAVPEDRHDPRPRKSASELIDEDEGFRYFEETGALPGDL